MCIYPPFPLLPSFKIVEHKGDNYSYNVGMREFAEFLKRKGYVIGNNEDKILQLIEVCRKTNTMPAFVIFGPPGVGKTWFTQLLAEFLNAEYLFYQATFGTTDDDLLYRFVPSENTVSGIEIIEGILPQSLRLSNNKLVVVVIDEFDKTRPSADALLLDYLQNARVSVKINNEEQYIIGDKSKIIFFITSNKVRDLSEPLLRRLMKLTFGFHNPEEVKKILSRHFGEELADTLKNIYMLNLEKELIKPITIQELIQFGYAIQEIKDIDFLIKTILLKEVEDYSNHSETIKLLLTDYLKLVEVFPIEELKNLEVFEEVDEGTNVAFKVLYEESTANGLTKLILLNPELEKKFKKVKVGTEKYIISEEPLTLKEFLLLEDY
ncbi:MAG: AAA family ATPase, partial [Candidatus Methanomethylicia archaeon]